MARRNKTNQAPKPAVVPYIPHITPLTIVTTQAALHSVFQDLKNVLDKADEVIKVTADAGVIEAVAITADTQASLSRSQKADISGAGAFLAGKPFRSWVGSIPETDTITIVYDPTTGKVTAESGAARFTANPPSVDGFPEPPIVSPEATVTLNGKVFREAAEKVLFAVAKHVPKDGFSPYECVHMTARPGALTVEAADGARIARVVVPLPKDSYTDDFDFFLKGTSLKTARSLVTDNEEIVLGVNDPRDRDGQYFVLGCKAGMYSAACLDVRQYYADLESLTPPLTGPSVKVNAVTLTTAIKRAELASPEVRLWTALRENGQYTIRVWSVSGDDVIVSDVLAEVDGLPDGHEIIRCINATYICDALEAVDSPKAALYFELATPDMRVVDPHYSAVVQVVRPMDYDWTHDLQPRAAGPLPEPDEEEDEPVVDPTSPVDEESDYTLDDTEAGEPDDDDLTCIDADWQGDEPPVLDDDDDLLPQITVDEEAVIRL